MKHLQRKSFTKNNPSQKILIDGDVMTLGHKTTTDKFTDLQLAISQSKILTK